MEHLNEFGHFILKQFRCSVFAWFIFAMLGVSYLFPWIPRYDFMLLTCLAMQIYMLKSGMESKQELLIISGFHLVGLILELYKVNHGSWVYPEFAVTKLKGVPLYSGFMYASVASYILRATKIFALEFKKMPKVYWASICVFLVYLNFFAAKIFGDQRLLITLVLASLFLPAQVQFVCSKRKYTMPLTVSFVLIGSCIYAGENIATYLGAWAYPHQLDGWKFVYPVKLISWILMTTVGFVMLWAFKTLEPRAHFPNNSKLMA
jgi:uncharacterized membrane protein YoaT (DUF817 family)